jgi:hypothetical protein
VFPGPAVSDLADGRRGKVEVCGNGAKRFARAPAAPNGTDVVRSQRAEVGATAATVSPCVGHVVTARAPIEVFDPVVCGVIVAVAGFEAGRARADERLKYETVNQTGNALAIATKVNVQMS